MLGMLSSREVFCLHKDAAFTRLCEYHSVEKSTEGQSLHVYHSIEEDRVCMYITL